MKTRALGDSNNVGLKEKEGPLQSCSRSEAHKPKLIRQKKKMFLESLDMKTRMEIRGPQCTKH